jgi:hypothetical protein
MVRPFFSLHHIILASCCYIIISVNRAEGRELKILDEAGLVRSVKSVEESSTVTISLEAEDGQVLHLSRVDGVGETVQQKVSKKTALFRNLATGTWKLEGDPRRIRAVRIDSSR